MLVCLLECTFDDDGKAELILHTEDRLVLDLNQTWVYPIWDMMMDNAKLLSSRAYSGPNGYIVKEEYAVTLS